MSRPKTFDSLTESIPALYEALVSHRAAVLSAPPGTGKTTQVPLQLLERLPLSGKRIVMLEPRRVAARTSARRMAQLLGESVGETVGYKVRFDSKVSSRTRIEVVTEGLLTRALQSDPELGDVGLVIFDEIHERSLASDLALALTLDVRTGLRDDLMVLAMSATAETARISQLLDDAPVIEASHRQFPVDVRYLGGPAEPGNAARAARQALKEQAGDVLVFLSGMSDIRKTESELSNLDVGARICVLHGTLDANQQDQVLNRAAERRVILSTNVAETSLTIDGVGAVVDTGWARVPRFEPGSGLTRLHTERVAQSSTIQRAGRAGRQGPGIAYRLWHEHEQSRRESFSPPEITRADLAPLLLELAVWGVSSPERLNWLDALPQPHVAQAKELLLRLALIEPSGNPTPTGRAVARLGLHPRLGLMLIRAMRTSSETLACRIAALLEEGSIWQGGPLDKPVDVEVVLDAMDGGQFRESVRRDVTARVEQAAQQYARRLKSLDGIARNSNGPLKAGALLALAYPERIGGGSRGKGRYTFSGGGAAQLPAGDALAQSKYIVAADVDVSRQPAQIRLAGSVTREDVESLFNEQIERREVVEWSARDQRVVAQSRRALGSIVLDTHPLANPPTEALKEAVFEGIRTRGISKLPWTESLRQWQARVRLMREFEGDGWPDVTDESLEHTLHDWLAPYLDGVNQPQDLSEQTLDRALRGHLDWIMSQHLDAQAPTQVALPNGKHPTIDYCASAGPSLEITLQDAFGLAETPRVAGGKQNVTLHLLSPAKRPIQVTQDLSGFWKSSYSEVRKEMRGRYPKHDWPEDPANAKPRSSSLKKHKPG